MGKLAPFAILCFVLASCNQSSNEYAADDIGDNQPKLPCAAIENMLATAEDCADLTALQQDVKPGPAALDAAPAMYRGKSYEVTLIIDRPLPPPEPAPPQPADDSTNTTSIIDNTADATVNLGNQVEPAVVPANETDPAPTANEVAAQLPGEDTHFRARVGRYMKATLTGSGFDINIVEPLDGMQEIARGGQGRWQWEVVPKMAGKRRLTVKTQAMGKVEGRLVPLGNGDTSQEIDVTVTRWDRFWDWVKETTSRIDAVTALFIALGALIAAVRPVRKAVWGFVSGLFKRRK